MCASVVTGKSEDEYSQHIAALWTGLTQQIIIMLDLGLQFRIQSSKNSKNDRTRLSLEQEWICITQPYQAQPPEPCISDQ